MFVCVPKMARFTICLLGNARSRLPMAGTATIRGRKAVDTPAISIAGIAATTQVEGYLSDGFKTKTYSETVPTPAP
jgi:hypothetical protein